MMFALFVSTALATAPAKKSYSEPACSGVKAACEKGGYSKGARPVQSKSPQHDCMDKLVAGQKVEGVTLDPADPLLGQCKAALDSSSSAKGH